MELNRGLRVSILTYKDQAYENSSNNGISRYVKDVVIVGEGVPPLALVSDNTPAVRIVKRIIGGQLYVHAEPVLSSADMAKVIGPMAGGSYIYSSDSRYADITGVPYPISLHDRYETQHQYDVLSR